MLSKIKMNSLPSEDALNQELLWFLKSSPTPFHAVETMARILEKNGYSELMEGEEWSVEKGKGYFVRRNDSSLVAFKKGANAAFSNGFRLVGTHTDSPCLKVKPNPEMLACSYAQLAVEIYGGVLLSTWFDRDLSLAGKVTYTNSAGELKKGLVDFKRPLAVVPNLAIHLNREANENRTINKQKEMPPLLFQLDAPPVPNEGTSFLNSLIMNQLENQEGEPIDGKVLGFDLCFYDTQDPAIVGYRNEFIAGARLDNLLSCYVGLRSLLEAGEDVVSVLVCNDHEEVGSVSHTGAQGPFLRSTLKRLFGEKDFERILDYSMMCSVDNAHGVHPNYPERHDPLHSPILNRGPVLKVNANQRYSTSGETAGIFQHLCGRAQVPMQMFAARSDMGCGSTIGPLTASILGLKAVDLGVPTFAMHSIRELAGVKDTYYLFKILMEFYKFPTVTIDS